MPQSSSNLTHQLFSMPGVRQARRFVVAYSGGLDSTALLHALASVTRAGQDTAILAVHVQHDLHADAGDWEQHCRRVAASLEVSYELRRVVVARDSGLGLEAAARAARYDALRASMSEGDWLLSAHHQDDQAETLMLNLLRGSGPAGLAGIGELQAFGSGYLARPLLHMPRATLEAYVAEHGLSWLQDSSNTDTRYDRNYLRAEIMPRLLERWPAAKDRLAHSAALASDAAELLEQLADADLAAMADNDDGIDLAWLATLSDGRARNVLRRAIRLAGLPVAPESALREILSSLLPARIDAEPCVGWSSAEARRYRGRLILMTALKELTVQEGAQLNLQHRQLRLGEIGELELIEGQGPGIQRSLLMDGLSLRRRVGGERIRPLGSAHTRDLKKLLQQAAIAPWLRDRIPLLYAGEQLVAVADLWLSAEHAEDGGFQVIWRPSPGTAPPPSYGT